ncbi:IQCM protein, partial [Galbula dea]|nr:IQCM protein [Galbula dea]
QKCHRSLSSQQLSGPYCIWGSTQTPVSAPSSLENKANSSHKEAFGKASWKRVSQHDSWLEKKLSKLDESALSVMLSPAFPEKAIRGEEAYTHLSPQYLMEQEETISVTKLLAQIDSVSRALENEKKENFSSCRSLDSPCAFPRPYGIPGFQITHKGKAYQDWRGMIAKNTVKKYSQERQKRLKGKETMADLQANKKKSAVASAKTGKRNMRDKHLDLQKWKKKAAQLEDFQAFCVSKKHPRSKELLRAVICIQRYVRGWLERRAFKRVKIKSTSHGPSLLAVVRHYRTMIAGIKARAGALDLSTPLHYLELEEWMDKKKFYEALFSKRESDKKMNRKDLAGFLRDCGYPVPASGVQRVLQLVCPASGITVRSIKKHQAVEMAFTLFPPRGAKVKNIIKVPLPWLNTVTDGK